MLRWFCIRARYTHPQALIGGTASPLTFPFGTRVYLREYRLVLIVQLAFAAVLRERARRAKDAKTGRDATHYSRFHPENYLSHHLAAIVCSAVMYDAAHIEEQIVALQLANKTRQQQQHHRASA